MFRKLIYLTVALLCLSATTTHAEILVPGGLNPGDMYYLAFVTDGTRNAHSSLIADYNQFVRDEAARSGAITETYGIDWFAIGSTATVAARDNAFVDGDIPIFLLDGTTKIADGFTDLWDASIDAPWNIDQFASSHASGNSWTGTSPDGFAHATRPLGTNPVLGFIDAVGSDWVDGTPFSPSFQARMYALSEKLTVVPEPSTVVLGLIGMLACGLVRRRRA